MPTVRVDSERKGIGGAQGGNREGGKSRGAYDSEGLVRDSSLTQPRYSL